MIKLDRLLREKDVKEWLERWKGYLDDDMICRMKIGTRDIPPIKVEEVLFLPSLAEDKIDQIVKYAVDKIFSEFDFGGKTNGQVLETLFDKDTCRFFERHMADWWWNSPYSRER